MERERERVLDVIGDGFSHDGGVHQAERHAAAEGGVGARPRVADAEHPGCHRHTRPDDGADPVHRAARGEHASDRLAARDEVGVQRAAADQPGPVPFVPQPP